MAGLGDFRASWLGRQARRVVRRLTGSVRAGGLGYKNLGRWQRAKHSRIAETTLRRIFPTAPDWPVDYTVYDYHGSDPDESAQWLRWNEFTDHLTGVLLKVDRASMFNSLEVRVPLLDREVIDVAVRIDWRDCFDLATGVGKLPLRKVLQRHVSYQSTDKKGFAPPMGQWLRTSLRPIVEETLLQRDELAGVAVDRKALRAVYREHLEGQRDYGWGFWPLLSLALWESRYGAGRGKAVQSSAMNFVS
jgi:asparagine synthase (glutamine-hydrolysing)